MISYARWCALIACSALWLGPLACGDDGGSHSASDSESTSDTATQTDTAAEADTVAAADTATAPTPDTKPDPQPVTYKGGWPIADCADDIKGTGKTAGKIAHDFMQMDQFGDQLRLHHFCDRVVLIVGAAFW